jgi:glutathione S-transferase
VKLYTFPPAPNPARVGFYLREKGLEIDQVMVDFRLNEQNSPEHLARNPVGVVPVLELDDGTCLTESLAIIEYLEELHPEPPMIGRNPLERALTRAREREIEMNVLLRVVRYVHAANSPLGWPPNPAIAEAEAARLPGALERVAGYLADGEFVMGDRPSIADCTLLAGVNFARAFTPDLVDGPPALNRWFESYALRHL